MLRMKGLLGADCHSDPSTCEQLQPSGPCHRVSALQKDAVGPVLKSIEK